MSQSALDHYSTQARIAELEAEVERLRQVNARLAEALQDFYDLRDRLDGISDAESRGRIYGDLSARAQAAISASKGA